MSLVPTGKTPKTRPPRPTTRRNLNKIPNEIIENEEINKIIESSGLPKNYNFEVYKTIHRIRKLHCYKVALQMPEGLLLFACALIDVFERANVVINEFLQSQSDENENVVEGLGPKDLETEFIIMGNVAYGACCVDDFTAGALECDLLIHYGHSCLVPINLTDKCENVLYIFVDIKIDAMHFINSIENNFIKNPENFSKMFNDFDAQIPSKIALMGTIQFAPTLQTCAEELKSRNIFSEVALPQARPLSKGEVLGCTSPKLDSDIDLCIFIADGRFHIESVMIMNPKVQFLRYNPYDKKLTKEVYNHVDMKSTRTKVIDQAMNKFVEDPSKPWIVLLSTLGRQGNPKILNNLLAAAKKINLPLIPVLMAEIQPQKLNDFKNTEVFIQIGCPRLSIDWGPDTIPKPLLTPYEGMIALKNISRPGWMNNCHNDNEVYPMDFYSSESSGNWTNNHKDNVEPRRKRTVVRSRKVINI